MGLDYALCAIVPASRAQAVLPALSRVLDAGTRASLDGLSLPALAAGEARCLALQVQLEPGLGDLFEAPGPDDDGPPGSLGCLWTTVRMGEAWLLLELVAATSAISAALQLSGRVHDLWRGFAQEAGAALAYLDQEDGAARCLYPGARHVALPVATGDTFDVDAWCSRLLAAARP